MRSSLPALLVLISCAHSEPAAPPKEDDSAPLVTPQQTPWKDMTHEEKGRYMRKVVTPKMREVFQAFDAKTHEKFGCGTCHGKDAKARDFKMPSNDLEPLPDSPEVFMATTMKEKPEMVKFMGEKVEPMVAELLARPPFNPAAPNTPDAFSCNGCHRLVHK